MNRTFPAVLWTLALVFTGCTRPVPAPPVPPRAERSASAEERQEAPRAERAAEVSFDTRRDGEFARFVQKTAGPLLGKLAVGIERKGALRIQLGEATSPEDTLPLTKSLLAGARKDFPDKAITLSVYDPKGEPILKAYMHPEQGVRYEVARGGEAGQGDSQPKSADARTAQAGSTVKDRHFAEWAMKKGQRYLRYVEADLERGGRLWFGVTQAVEPDDVSQLTKALLEGARTEFPRRELTATVFDPEGERIGRATLDANGKVRWAR
jgi:hypothetical protein